MREFETGKSRRNPNLATNVAEFKNHCAEEWVSGETEIGAAAFATRSGTTKPCAVSRGIVQKRPDSVQIRSKSVQTR
jgi:hypothetical protein